MTHTDFQESIEKLNRKIADNYKQICYFKQGTEEFWDTNRINYFESINEQLNRRRDLMIELTKHIMDPEQGDNTNNYDV